MGNRYICLMGDNQTSSTRLARLITDRQPIRIGTDYVMASSISNIPSIQRVDLPSVIHVDLLDHCKDLLFTQQLFPAKTLWGSAERQGVEDYRFPNLNFPMHTHPTAPFDRGELRGTRCLVCGELFSELPRCIKHASANATARVFAATMAGLSIPMLLLPFVARIDSISRQIPHTVTIITGLPNAAMFDALRHLTNNTTCIEVDSDRLGCTTTRVVLPSIEEQTEAWFETLLVRLTLKPRPIYQALRTSTSSWAIPIPPPAPNLNLHRWDTIETRRAVQPVEQPVEQPLLPPWQHDPTPLEIRLEELVRNPFRIDDTYGDELAMANPVEEEGEEDEDDTGDNYVDDLDG